MRWNVFYGIAGMYIFISAMENLLLRWSDEILGRTKTLDILITHLEEISQQSWFFQWVLFIGGLAIIIWALFFSDKENV